MNLKDLAPNPRNPRTISDDQLTRLAKSLEKFGDISGFVFNRRTGRLAGGHQRGKALPDAPITITREYAEPTRSGTVAEGYVEINGERFSIRFVDWDEQTEHAANVAANKHGGSFDNEKLREIMLELDHHNFDLDLTGFSLDELDILMAPVHKMEPQCDEDEIPERVEPRTKLGDIYRLGNHRVKCGDSTILTQVEELMNGEKAELLWTDPPYGVSYADKNAFQNSIALGKRIQERILGDHQTPDQMNEFWFTVLSNAFAVLEEKSSYYIASPQGGDLMMMMSIIRAGFQLKHMLIWVKNNHVLGRCDYNYKHEPMLYGWKENGTHEFYGAGRCKTSVWDFNKPTKNDLHPTMKPVELIEESILNSSGPGRQVLDLFGGSGSTLIACEKTGRKCFMMELDPHYVDVICARWEKFTGRKAELIPNDGLLLSGNKP